MKTREVTYDEAADLLSTWGDRRITSLIGPAPDALDWSLQDACDGLCRWLADDPDRELTGVPRPLLIMLRARLGFAVGACITRSGEVIGRVPASAPDQLVLSRLLGGRLAGTRLPPEWRPQ